jgi:hypothetical protein
MSLRIAAGAALLSLVTAAASAGQNPPRDATASPVPAGIIRVSSQPLTRANRFAAPTSGSTVGTFRASSPDGFGATNRGRYEIKDLKAGRYNLTVSKVGYLTVGYGQRRPAETARPVDVTETTPLENSPGNRSRCG